MKIFWFILSGSLFWLGIWNFAHGRPDSGFLDVYGALIFLIIGLVLAIKEVNED